MYYFDFLLIPKDVIIFCKMAEYIAQELENFLERLKPLRNLIKNNI